MYRLSTLLACNHLESLTDYLMKNDRIISPAELIVKCLAVNSWIQESWFCLDFYFKFSKVDCRTLCLERIFWALQTVLHIILIKGTDEFIPLSAALVHMFSSGTEAPHLLRWELGTREESGCLVPITCRITSCHQLLNFSFHWSSYLRIWRVQPPKTEGKPYS